MLTSESLQAKGSGACLWTRIKHLTEMLAHAKLPKFGSEVLIGKESEGMNGYYLIVSSFGFPVRLVI